MRTSGTVIECRSNTSSMISPRKKMSASACRIISPTFSWRWEGGLPLSRATMCLALELGTGYGRRIADLQRALDVLDVEALDDVGRAHVLVALERHAAFLACGHLAHLVLEALQGRQLAFVDHHIIADEPDLSATLHLALRDAAAGDLAHLGDCEHLQNLGIAEEGLVPRGCEHAGHGLLHLVNEVVDHRVITDFHALALGHLPRLCISSHIEAEHDRARSRGEPYVGLGDATHSRMDDARAHLVGAHLVERRDDGFDRALHVTLDEEGELLDAGGLQIGHHLLEAAAGARDRNPLPALAHTIVGDLARPRLVLHHGELIAGLRR